MSDQTIERPGLRIPRLLDPLIADPELIQHQNSALPLKSVITVARLPLTEIDLEKACAGQNRTVRASGADKYR